MLLFLLLYQQPQPSAMTCTTFAFLFLFCSDLHHICLAEEGPQHGVTPETTEGAFDYMKAGDDRTHAHALAQEYMTKLVHGSAPALYLPLLAHLVQTPQLPSALKVR